MACDETLYRQYLSGDDAGLEALMKKYGDPLTLYIDGYLHDVHEAEELMLDVFAYLFTKRPKIRDGGFKAYLYKAARHIALRHRSTRKLQTSDSSVLGLWGISLCTSLTGCLALTTWQIRRRREEEAL